MTDHYLSSINAQIESFPALPEIVPKVMAVTANPESSANDLMQIILPDQAMCATILKVANSAFFGIPREVSTIERAVVVLGYQEIKNIVIGKAIFSSFPKMTKETRHRVGLFWEHTFTCGLAAKIIGEHLCISPSELFIAGLIHDIGKLAMFLTFPSTYPILQELANHPLFNDIAEEQKQFTISHDQVGLELAKKWLLPEQLIAAIGYHHAPLDTTTFRQYPLIIQVADILSLMYCGPEILRAEDVSKMFADFLPETGKFWQESGLNWNDDNLGLWFERLKLSRQCDQAILSIFTSE
ncbi:MAG: HDOD domain-containing protein [Proteobacteria bacterium]|nr:HDOD domain-containing protein [Pseudomonadota bacterium]